MSNTTSLKLSEELKDKVNELAHGVAQTPHAYMVEAIAEKVARDERRRDFLKSGSAAAARFKSSGVVFTHRDVVEYARARAAGKKARKPRPVRIPPSER